ncbi:THxN family PEP-CTERM protein [Pedomonas mirosovicensis]|uniref:THxN family PEP-CTERM protein n=1 Tax=Pedomonas mirosovicensis TaxID=2908641 RepID=UPI00216A590B|nr:THxN family PEP-CTERM protein [Pedomonas mirosovicensis]MCH8685381.1 THxN family PEP-CTERM protein [Pedomonas mirosovicensis]
MTKMKSLLPAIAVLASAAVPSMALAEPIQEWSFTISNQWDQNNTAWVGNGSTPADAFGSGSTLPDGADPAGDYAFVRWGSPENSGGNRSFLAADTNLTQSSVFTNGAGAAGAYFYHGNYSLRTGANYENTLDKTRLISQIEITSVTPTGVSTTINRAFNIDFTETLNSQNGDSLPIEECAGYETWGSAVNVASCPDSFTIDTSALRFTTEAIDGYVYDFTVAFDLSTLDGIVGVGFDGDLATIWTSEGILSRIGTIVTVTAREVPEPGSIALLGAGLLTTGLGLRRRRRAR